MGIKFRNNILVVAVMCYFMELWFPGCASFVWCNNVCSFILY